MSENDLLEEKAVLMSIIYQLALDCNADVDCLNPNVLDYIDGLCAELQDINEESEELAQRIFYYADTYFNNLYGIPETLH